MHRNEPADQLFFQVNHGVYRDEEKELDSEKQAFICARWSSSIDTVLEQSEYQQVAASYFAKMLVNYERHYYTNQHNVTTSPSASKLQFPKYNKYKTPGLESILLESIPSLSPNFKRIAQNSSLTSTKGKILSKNKQKKMLKSLNTQN